MIFRQIVHASQKRTKTIQSSRFFIVEPIESSRLFQPLEICIPFFLYKEFVCQTNQLTFYVYILMAFFSLFLCVCGCVLEDSMTATNICSLRSFSILHFNQLHWNYETHMHNANRTHEQITLDPIAGELFANIVYCIGFLYPFFCVGEVRHLKHAESCMGF